MHNNWFKEATKNSRSYLPYPPAWYCTAAGIVLSGTIIGAVGGGIGHHTAALSGVGIIIVGAFAFVLTWGMLDRSKGDVNNRLAEVIFKPFVPFWGRATYWSDIILLGAAALELWLIWGVSETIPIDMKIALTVMSYSLVVALSSVFIDKDGTLEAKLK